MIYTARLTLALVVSVFLVACSNSSSDSLTNQGGSSVNASELNVAYFLEWSTPNLIAKAENTFDERLGVRVVWTSYTTGVEMTQAMINGDIDLSYSQGFAPFIVGVNNGARIQTVALATQYPGNVCVVRNGTGITTTNARLLEGRTAAVPLATTTEYSFRRQMAALDVDISSINVVDLAPGDALVALANGTVDLACLFGSETVDMALQFGTVLMPDEQMVANGIIHFDVVSATDQLIADNPQLIERFLEVTNEANVNFQGTQADFDIIVSESGLSEVEVQSQLRDFSFPSSSRQLDEYFGDGGLIEEAFNVAGEVFSNDENTVLPDYSLFINPSFQNR